MEHSLSGRQFIERFHLPQLVRICSLDAGQRECDRKANWSERCGAVNQQTSRSLLALASSGKTAASNLTSGGRRLEQSDADWTYAPGKCRVQAASSGSKSLHWAAREAEHEQAEQSGHSSLMLVGRQAEPSRRLLPRVKLQVAPDIELGAQEVRRQAGALRELRPRRGRRGPEIRLAPVNARPALAKLQLEQPFLLYKAYRKLEVCAYTIDLNNELNEKSGDPIFLPHNYQGWFTLLPRAQASCTAARRGPENGAGRQVPLESIDQVCHSAGQLFLTRDELLGYQLPSKLSQLTKLANQQLLAVPLAINLESGKQRRHLASAKGTHEVGQTGSSKSSAGISNLEQIVIAAGQVLRICAIYEDVLPLIEKSGGGHSKKQSQQQPLAFEAGHSQHKAELINQRGGAVYAPAVRRAASQQAPTSGSDQRLHADSSQVASGLQQQAYSASQMISPQGQLVAPPLIYAKQQPMPTSQPLVQSRRYARCVLLSDESLDQMTGCSASPSSSRPQESGRVPDEQRANGTGGRAEVEVLIPVDQPGRFYLCATSQTLASEWLDGCQDCSFMAGSERPPAGQLVFRLSQIIYLVNLNKRLSAGAPSTYVSNSSSSSACSGRRSMQAGRSHKSWRPLSSSFTLPLQVELVIGPRPANFSPSMFGPSSTMESYFSREANVGGHAFACRFHRNSPRAGQPQVMKPARANAPICACPQQVEADSSAGANQLAWFSATLRLESIAKRDVLLACTIKESPLEQMSGSGTLSGEDRHRAAIGASLKVVERSGSKSIGAKSSMSRLRAYRSLISLNGRKKRNRPQIPSSMLVDCELAPRGGATRWVEQDGASSLESLRLGQSGDELGAAKQKAIILLEFDCNDPELKLKRTFVEQSLPSASIPDLVLRRMQFCQANSACWERQLKLSNSSLSGDFDAHRDELLATRLRAKVSASGERQLAGERGKSLSQSFLQRCQFDARSYQRTIGHTSSPSYVNSTKCSEQQAAPAVAANSGSTGSSRSSSGVSSSGEHLHMLLASSAAAPEGGHKSLAKSDLSSSRSTVGSSLAATNLRSDLQRRARSQVSNEFAEARLVAGRPPQQQQQRQDTSAADEASDLEPERCADSSSRSSSASSLLDGAKSSPSRLLRLVHKILPLGAVGKPPETGEPGDGTHPLNKAAGGHSQRQMLIAELSGRLKESAAQRVVAPREEAPTSTLMNSQKLHRRLMTGSVRYLPTELLDSLMQEDENEERASAEKGRRGCAGGGGGSTSSCSSHLYESLERLNESLALAGKKVSGAAPKADIAAAGKFQSAPGDGLQQRRHAEGLALVAGRREVASSRLERQMRRIRRSSNDATTETRVGFERAAAQTHLEEAGERWRGSVGSVEAAGNRDDGRATTESSYKLELAAEVAAKKLSSGKAQAKRIALSWRQKLVAKAGRRRSSARAKQPDQDTSSPGEIDSKGRRQRRRHLAAAGAPPDGCRDFDHKLDMEPVSIEACDGPELDASSGDELANASAANNDHHQPPTSSSSFFSSTSSTSSSSSSTSTSCSPTSLASSAERDREKRPPSPLIERRDAEAPNESIIYVNLAGSNTSKGQRESRAASLSSGGEREELERLAEGVRQKTRGTQQLVSRMERKLAKLRGRCESRQRAPPDKSSARESNELRSLGWEPVHELFARPLTRNSGLARSCELSRGPLSLPCESATRVARRPGSSLSSSSSINLSSASSQEESSSTSSAAGPAAFAKATASEAGQETNRRDQQSGPKVNRISLQSDERRQVTPGNSRDLSASLARGRELAGSLSPTCSSPSTGRKQKVASSAQPLGQMWPQRLLTLDRATNVAEVAQQLDNEWT